MMKEALSVSVVVPTYREAPNIQPLTERLFAALEAAGLQGELIVVDDNSQDGSAEKVEELSKRYPVRIIVRTTQRGLSSAVLAGFADARNDIMICMDADLQHPPEAVPSMVAILSEDQADFVLGSRYVDQGAIVGDWSLMRRVNAFGARLLARPLTNLRDPMSGFFGIHRATFENAARLDPIGYKIGLEMLVKGRCRRSKEIPIEFAQRTAGESKLSLSEQLRYLRHLIRLYRFRLTDRRGNGRS
ncbi:MAG: polyprenol monophosphomannose synthase [Planctomycetes bacterium]|nr:polyprenol monophosphomannose synthase [Planctomycetota bacterium]